VVRFRFLGIKNLKRICSTRNHEDGRFEEVFGEFFSVKSGRGDNDLEIGYLFDSLYERIKNELGRKKDTATYSSIHQIGDL